LNVRRWLSATPDQSLASILAAMKTGDSFFRQTRRQQLQGGIDEVAPQISRFCEEAGSVRAVDDQR
jgi:hypothetical protein